MGKKKSANSYFQQRADLLGFDPNVHYSQFNPLPDEPYGKMVQHPLAWADDKGNFCLGFPDLDGGMITHDSSNAKSKIKIEPYHLIRFAKPVRAKYLPSKSDDFGPFAWIPPSLIEKYLKKKRVRRLIITEGPIKALAAYIAGIEVIAIPGILCWKPKADDQIFYHIRKIVETCQVEEILWLTDGDSLMINFEPEKDLHNRPRDFANSVINFRKMCRPWDLTLYYGHITKEHPKGLDDLIVAHPEDVELIKKELLHPVKEYKYTNQMNVTTMSDYKIKQYFGIHKGAGEFYKRYEEYIEDEKFVYKYGLYEWDEDADKIIYLKRGESASYVRVGKQFFRLGSKPTLNGSGEKLLIPVSDSEIHHEHIILRKGEREQIINDISYFHGFLCRPAHHNYQQVIEYTDDDNFTTRWYNNYKRITWKPKEGSCPTSMKFIKHIFGEELIDIEGRILPSYELGLDYIKLLWERPTIKLPILSLVSKERHTGKTTFWDWMRLIFQKNAMEIRQESLTKQFNSSFMDKILVVIDETVLDKRQIMERVKSLTTAKKTEAEAKYQNSGEEEIFFKVGMSSNNINNFAIIDKEENRFWVRDVPRVGADEMNYTLLEDLEREIPQFLNLLEARELVTTQQGRMWFREDLYLTEALLRVKNQSRSSNEVIIESCIVSHMMDVDKPVIHLSSKDLKHILDDNKFSLKEIRWVVDLNWQIPRSSGSQEYQLWTLKREGPADEFVVHSDTKKSQFYIFMATDFLKSSEILKHFSNSELISLEKSQIKYRKKSFFNDLQKEDILGSLKGYNALFESKLSEVTEVIEKSKSFEDLIKGLEEKNNLSKW